MVKELLLRFNDVDFDRIYKAFTKYKIDTKPKKELFLAEEINIYFVDKVKKEKT